MAAAVSILGVNCSPAGGGKTRAAIEAVLAGAAAAGAAIELVELAGAIAASSALHAVTPNV